MGENSFARIPVILYGIDLLCAAVSYYVLVRALLARHGKDSLLAKAIVNDFKGKISVFLYVAAIWLSFLHPLLACGLYAFVAVMWIIPDQRIEKVLK